MGFASLDHEYFGVYRTHLSLGSFVTWNKKSPEIVKVAAEKFRSTKLHMYDLDKKNRLLCILLCLAYIEGYVLILTDFWCMNKIFQGGMAKMIRNFNST